MEKIILIIAVLMGGCSVSPVVMYEGKKLPREEVAIVSVFGNYGDKKVSLRLAEVNREIVPGASNFMTYEVQLTPGVYKLKYYVWHDLRATSWKETYIEIENTLLSGHTYFPDVEIIGGTNARIWLVDKGVNYPVECNHGLLASNKDSRENCK